MRKHAKKAAIVAISKTWCGNVSYDRFVGRKWTHGLEFDCSLPAADLEAFRAKPDAFIADLQASAEEPEQEMPA